MKILIIGGSGYIGTQIVLRLKNEHKLTISSRNPKEIDGVKTLKGNVTDKQFLLDNVQNFDLIIYLAAIVRAFKKSKYKENIEGTENIIEAMKKNRIKKIIYFSTHNVYNNKTGYYGNSKKICEKLVIDSNLDYILVRPNYVYGIDKGNDIYTLINIIKKMRIAPIIGNGNTKLQPINKEDIADITFDLIKNFKSNVIYDISGSKSLSFNDIVNFTQKQINKRCIKIHISLSILKVFKFIIPFDVDGFTEDRLSRQKPFKLKHEIYEDLKQIINLK